MEIIMRLIASFLLGIFLIAAIQSCTPLVVGSVIATVTAVTTQDKSLGNIIDDTATLLKISKAFLKYGLFSSIKIKVSEGMVLLIGNVDSPKKQLKAEKIAWQQNGVKEVVNEIKVTPIKTSSILNTIIDSLITTEIKTRLLGKRKIRSINYSVNTVNRVVYLIGISQDEAELKSVLGIVRKVKGVKQVISYVRYKDSKLRH